MVWNLYSFILPQVILYIDYNNIVVPVRDARKYVPGTCRLQPSALCGHISGEHRIHFFLHLPTRGKGHLLYVATHSCWPHITRVFDLIN